MKRRSVEVDASILSRESQMATTAHGRACIALEWYLKSLVARDKMTDKERSLLLMIADKSVFHWVLIF